MDLANWLESKPQIENAAGIPKRVQYWPDTSWKKTATEYAVTNHLFWSYPKTSFTTNQGVAGTHESEDGNQLQSPLSIAKNNFHFTNPEETIATYDAFMEWMPLNNSPIPQLNERVDFDLHGLKTANDLWHDKVITIRKPAKEICSWGRALKPPEMNLIQNIPGNFFHLCSAEAFTNASEASIATADDMGYYQVHTSGKRAGVFLFDRILKRLKLKK
jgi:hypothetical protein